MNPLSLRPGMSSVAAVNGLYEIDRENRDLAARSAVQNNTSEAA